jgi:hypothetical protein
MILLLNHLDLIKANKFPKKGKRYFSLNINKNNVCVVSQEMILSK